MGGAQSRRRAHRRSRGCVCGRGVHTRIHTPYTCLPVRARSHASIRAVTPLVPELGQDRGVVGVHAARDVRQSLRGSITRQSHEPQTKNVRA